MNKGVKASWVNTGLALALLLGLAWPALAVPPGYTVAVDTAGLGAGVVTSSPPGISCPTTCSATFFEGSTVTLTATGDPGSELGSWSGDCGGPGPCTLTIDAPKRAVAGFKPVGDPYTVRRFLMGGRSDGRNPYYVTPVTDGTYLYGMTYRGGLLDRGVVFRTRLDGTEHVILHEFLGGANDGANPYGALLLDGGVLYGMTYAGGASNLGTIFHLNASGGGFGVIHSFAGEPSDGAYPLGALIVDSGVLYGMTRQGGASGFGTIFQLDLAGGGPTLLHSFAGGPSDGGLPYGSLVRTGGVLYGMTAWGGAYEWGTVFKYDPAGMGLELLHSFIYDGVDGYVPYGSLTIDGATLYGMTAWGGAYDYGTVFTIGTNGGSYGILHEFDYTSDGADPYGSLLLSGGTLYGMLQAGGASGQGAIFSMSQAGGSVAVIHSFAGGANDGRSPYGSLALDGGRLYGMTSLGGAADVGTVFGCNLDGQSFGVLHSFAAGGGDGLNPQSALTPAGGALYGMTPGSGASGLGTIYKVNPDGSGYRLLHEFTGTAADGAYPYGALTQAGSGLYGMTSQGGASGAGTIFTIGLDGTGFQVVHSFAGGAADGAYPYGSLTWDGTTLFGMTFYGGSANNRGTVFAFDPGSGGVTVLHSFAGGTADGRNPRGSLALDAGVLYGMTQSGGASSYGTVFKVGIDGQGYTPLHSFTGTTDDGRQPYDSLVVAGGVLYGMTSRGGANGSGTVFKVGTDGNGFALLHSFPGSPGDGTYPYGSLTLDGGVLYGTAYQGGANSRGALFRMSPDGTGYALVCSFVSGAYDGSYPRGSLAVVGGQLHGTASSGGPSSGGTIFSLRHAFTVSGTVTRGGVGLAGVTMVGLPGSPVTDAAGSYTATVPILWSGKVTPTLAGHVFIAPYRSYSDLKADLTGQDYVAFMPPKFTSASTTTFLTGLPGSFKVKTTGSPTPSLGQSGALPGGVTFVDNGDGTGTLAGTPAVGTAGTYRLEFTAVNGAPSTYRQSFTLSVTPPARTTTSVVSSRSPAPAGSVVRFTAKVTFYTRTLGVPTGTVEFFANGSSLGTTPLVSAQAVLQTTTLPVGTYPITAVYSGDTKFAGSTGTLAAQTVY